MTSDTKPKLRVLIVDDEPLAREGLLLLLAEDQDVEIVGQASDGRSAVRAIEKRHPDIVFLDVQMPEYDGLEVLRRISPDKMPIVVLVTAYDRYAVDAFEAAALDYLLKPVQADRLARTMERIKRALQDRQASHLTQKLLSLARDLTLHPTPRHSARLPVTVSGRIQFVEVDRIDWIEAQDYYARLHTGKSSHLIRRTLSSLEEELDSGTFARIHRSTMVNLSRIKELQPQGRGEYLVTLQDGTRLKLSRSYRDRLARFLP